MQAVLLRTLVDVQLLQGDTDAAVLLCETHLLDQPAASEAGARRTTPMRSRPVPEAPSTSRSPSWWLLRPGTRPVGGEMRAAALVDRHLCGGSERCRRPPRPPRSPSSRPSSSGASRGRDRGGQPRRRRGSLGQVTAILEESGDPRLPTALNNLGSISFERGRPLEALTQLEAAIISWRRPGQKPTRRSSGISSPITPSCCAASIAAPRPSPSKAAFSTWYPLAVSEEKGDAGRQRLPRPTVPLGRCSG
jgi:hypothetical protein